MANSDYKILSAQKHFIEHTYSCFKCVIKAHGQYMKCSGSLHPLEYIEPYQVEIIQVAGYSPKVYIKRPKIEYDPKIHMYEAGHLCLYYPQDFNWKPNSSIANYTIPWVNEWIIYYELFKISGKWEGPAAPHGIVE
jgi:hypothetical protein